MDFSQLPLFSLFSQRMSWLTQRQSVLAQNVANLDTPGYKPRDLKEVSFDEMLRGVSSRPSLSRTDGRHLPSSRDSASQVGLIKEKPVETTLSGNSVNLETELMNIGEAADDHQLVTDLYRKQIEMFRTVLGTGT